ncbi:uncharacterized protein LOC144162708 [Haemaphysalis longicornis]
MRELREHLQRWAELCVSSEADPCCRRLWGIFQSVLKPRGKRNPLAALAIRRNSSYEELAGLFAKHFLTPHQVAAGQVVAAPEESEGRPFNDTPITEAELRGALRFCKRKSAHGADGLTYQLLRNLDEVGFAKLLAAYNRIWATGRLPPDWLLPILLEQVDLRRMQAITAVEELISEQLTGFRRHRAATDSIADVVAALQHARETRQVAALLLLDVKGAFDNMQRPSISMAMEEGGIAGKLRSFVEVFLTGRTTWVHVGSALSVPPSSGPQPDCLPRGGAHRVYMSVYTDDVALWVVVDAVRAKLVNVGLQLSTSKTEAILRTALWLYNATAVGLLMYGVPLFTPPKSRWRQLEGDHRRDIHTFLGLPRDSQCAKTLGEVGASAAYTPPLAYGAHKVVAPVEACRALEDDVCTDIPGLRSKPRTSHCGQVQLARGVVWGDLEGHTLVYTDGSVRQREGSATLEPSPKRCTLLCDSRVALLRMREGDPLSLLVRAVRNKVARRAERGARMRLQWVTGHIGMEGNERADKLAADALELLLSPTAAQTLIVSLSRTRSRRPHAYAYARTDR